MKFFRNKIFSGFWALAIALVSISGTWAIVETSHQFAPVQTKEELYQNAVWDAVEAEVEEIQPLVSLTREDQRVSWNDDGERVLLLSWHHYPDSYIQGEAFSLERDIWTFTDKEIKNWVQTKGKDVTDWNLRLEQLIGLPPEAGYTHMTGFWVKPEDVVRPAYVTDTTKPMENSFSSEPEEEYKAWFDGNIIFSYFESAYPWTRLGYTYDWANNGTEYGLTEFIIKTGASVEIAFTMDTESFIASIK